jgi:hypothetical protein
MKFTLKLHLQIFLAFVLICPGLALASVPACHALFAEGFSILSEDLSRTIADLASLRYSLDMKKAEGTKNLAWNALARDYDLREKALMAELQASKSMTEAQLKQKISEEIKKLQKVKNIEKEQTQAERQNVESVKIGLPDYVFKESVQISLPSGRDDFFEYVKQSDSVLYKNERKIMSFQLANGKKETVAENVALARMFSDQKRMLMVTTGWEVSVHDFHGKTASAPVKLAGIKQFLNPSRNDFKDFQGIDISPDGTKLALGSTRGFFAIYDIAKGELLASGANTRQSLLSLHSIRFVSDHEIIFNTDQGLGRYDMKSRDLKFSDSKAYGRVAALELSGDRTQAFFTSAEMFLTISTETLEVLNQDFITLNFTKLISRPVRSSFDHVYMMFAGTTRSSGIYSSQALHAPVFNFNDKYSVVDSKTQPVLLDVAFPRDPSTVVVLVKSGREFFIERWVRTPRVPG